MGLLIQRITDDTISGKIAKTVFESLWEQEGSVDSIIEKKGLRQVTDSNAIEQLIDAILAENPGHVAEFRAGKDKLFGFFVGQVMKKSGGKVNPQQLNELLQEKLRPDRRRNFFGPTSDETANPQQMNQPLQEKTKR